ncbi:MAG: 6-phosphofructokinase [Gammaproteobacteria bacterium]|nr:6-phosphofructokinase [Gammaproteobacteria bacterium]NIR83930.1 6-phosphofructokinase [Gammaproteobacteria bacterium]NIR88973.1 6-phosphofructokinase [Gammaproteobacteria bacterium]NIV74526.1 phosphofructokinase [Gammaproteobacteria bacterium]
MKKLLLVFDGGLAPGYTAAAVGMTEEGEARGYEIWAAREGFRSLTGDTLAAGRLERVVMGMDEAFELSRYGIAAHAMYRRIDMAGSEFRSERYPEFETPARQRQAAAFVRDEGFTHLVFLGGNGTFQGARALCGHLDAGIRVGFINCSVDSDLLGDRSVGFLTALEAGSQVARGLFEDAYTHRRHYILEMMGNHGGKHALHCGCAARAHLIILPQMDLSPEIMCDIAQTLAEKSHSLTIVAEGYKKRERAERCPELSASEYFKRELARFGFEDRPERRVLAESYSRFIRGVRPLMMECEIAYLKSQLIYKAFDRGESGVIAYYLGEHNLGTRPMEQVRTDNGVEPLFLDMIDRFRIASLREQARCVYNN